MQKFNLCNITKVQISLSKICAAWSMRLFAASYKDTTEFKLYWVWVIIVCSKLGSTGWFKFYWSIKKADDNILHDMAQSK